MNSYEINFGIIEKYINANDLTKTAFCKRCGISVATLNRLIRGENASLDSAIKVANRIGVPVCRLFK